MNPMAFRKSPPADTPKHPTRPPIRLAPLRIEPGARYALKRDSTEAVVQPREVTQRNWSRVGDGVFQANGESPHDCFVKQYIDRGGATHPDHLRFEYEGARVASAILGDIVKVPTILCSDDTHLINVFEHHALITVDELLREDEKRFWRFFPLLLERYNDILQAMLDGATQPIAETLPEKSRPYSSQGSAINFKGFEVRNTGYALPLDADDLRRSPTALPPVVMFDFVRPYLAPVEEAGAKLLVSIGLLNWGKPLSRFIQGPDMEMLDMAFHYVGRWTHLAAMEAELAIQSGFRFATVKGASRSETGLKKAGLNLIGRHYMRKLEQWTQRRFAGH